MIAEQELLFVTGSFANMHTPSQPAKPLGIAGTPSFTVL